MSPIIVSFYPGTSGRFLSAVCHMLYHNIIEEIKWNDDNSAHDYNKFYDSYWKDAPEYFTKDIQFLNSKMIFKYLDLEPNKIMPTHAFPDFDLIKEKSPNCKIIIISCNEHDFPEIALNLVLKNKSIISTDYHQKVLNVQTRKFRSIKIPDEYKDNVLVIKYDEIYEPVNNTYIGLEKISKFLNLDYNNIILTNYKSYVAGRDLLLQKNNIAKI